VRPPTDPILGVVPADPALRRAALAGWGVVGVLGLVVLWYVLMVLRRADSMALYDPRGAFLEVQRIAVPIMVVWTIGGIGISAWLLISAMRIIRAGRFPAPGARMVRTTHLRHGVAAHRIGLLMLLLASVMLSASVAMPVFLRRVMQAVERSIDRFRAVEPDTDAVQPRGAAHDLRARIDSGASPEA
jgi:hypothetical protein